MRTKNPGPQCTVYFDGDCPICSREINIYRRAAGGDLAHDRAFAAVAVAAAAEDDVQPVAGIGAQRRNGILEGIGLVGVIDEDGRAGLASRHQVEPAPGALQGFDRPHGDFFLTAGCHD